jgi:hypothetical protein
MGKLGKLWIVIEHSPHSYDIWAHLPLTINYKCVKSKFTYIGRKCLYKGPPEDLHLCYTKCSNYLVTQKSSGYFIRKYYIAKGRRYPTKLKKLNKLHKKCETQYI